ncbi:hypothetical protein [Sutcliffiella cohnii]|uniref:hypothetical protein n=1 Tax=Sutcliffiella cohnii TaxID=33932 RepID=UPI002E1B227B|nr:hypothetical protein [Sutcliffiella cohnii]
MEQENTFELRNPKSSDLFALIRIIGKMKIKRELQGIGMGYANINKLNKQLKKAKKNKESNIEELETELEAMQLEVGMQLPFIFLENIDKAEGEVEKLFANLAGMTEEEYKDSDMEITINIFNAIRENEKWSEVLQKALKLLKM